MFKQIAELIAVLLNISRRSEDHDRRLTTAEDKLERLTRTVDLMLAELQHTREREQAEREKQELRLQLTLERLERRLALPPSPSSPSAPELP